MYDFRRLRGWNRLTGGSLVTLASILVRLHYDYGWLCGWNRFAGGSLVTFASILVRVQAKREGGDYVLASFNIFMLCMILAGCEGGTVSPAAL